MLGLDDENKENIFHSINIGSTIKHQSWGKAKKKQITIAVEGNIGSGKSTFLEHFRKDPIVEVIPEPVDLWKNFKGHNMLDLMYKDPKRWSYAFQSYVQLTMLNVHKQELPKKKRVKFMERSIFSGRYCFLQNLFESKLLTDVDSAILDEWFHWIQENVNLKLDLIVYLKASPLTCHKRINGRQRDEESAIPMSYLETLHRLHEDWLINETRYNLPAPLLILDGEKDVSTLVKVFESQKKALFDGVW